MVTWSRSIMRAIFALVIALLFAEAAWATSVSGKLIDITGAPVSATNALVRVTLLNYGSSLPRVVGSHVIASPKIDLEPDASGYFSGTLTGNDLISPSRTFYRFCVISNGSQFRCADYRVSGSTFDLDSESPISTSPVVAAPTGDNTYLRLDGGNQPTGSIVPNTDSSQNLGSSAARWEGFFDGIDLASMTSSTSNPASAGTIRLANNTDKACWRNAANTADVCIYLDSSDVLQLPTANVTGSLTLGGVPLAVYPAAGIPVSTGSSWGASLTAPSGTIVGTTDMQGLSNKTLTSPVINTSVTGSALQGTDSKLLTAGTISGTGSTLCTDANGGVTTSGCPSGGVSDATMMDVGYLSGLDAVCATTNSTCRKYIFPNPHTLVRLVANVTTAPVGCTTNASWGVIDLTSSTVLQSLTPSTAGVLDSGAISVSMTAGHDIGIGITQTDAGCSTHAVGAVTATFE